MFVPQEKGTRHAMSIWRGWSEGKRTQPEKAASNTIDARQWKTAWHVLTAMPGFVIYLLPMLGESKGVDIALYQSASFPVEPTLLFIDPPVPQILGSFSSLAWLKLSL